MISRKVKLAILVVKVVVLCACVFHYTPVLCGKSVQNRPLMERADRVELARQILANAKVENEEKRPEDRAETHYMAMIDPSETARYILANPLPPPQLEESFVLWDYSALIEMFSHPELLSDDEIVQLLDTNHAEFAFDVCIKILAKKLPADRNKLRKRIVELARTKPFVHPKSGLSKLISKRELFEEFGLADEAAKNEEAIKLYYVTGTALEDYRKIQKQPQDEDSSRFLLAEIATNAPPDVRGEFADAPPRAILHILADKSLTAEALEKEISESAKRDLQGNESVSFQLASSLGKVAGVDPNLAEKVRAELKNATLEIWADINIAVYLADRDREGSRKRLRDVYQRLRQLRLLDAEIHSYNYPLPLIAAVGLVGVEFVAPEDLPESISIVAEIGPDLLKSEMGDAKANFFELVAAVARYDMETARALLKQADHEVSLHDAGSYFTALAAVEPTRILEEFKEIPLEADERGITYRPYIRNSVIPSLCAHTDDEFWDLLTRQAFLVIEKPKSK